MYNNMSNFRKTATFYPGDNGVMQPGVMNYGNNDERFGGFFVPFLLGGLTGSAAVAVARPRPVYVNPAPYPYPYYPGPYYGPRPY